MRGLSSLRRQIVMAPLSAFLMLAGCGYPQAAPTNLRMISALRTALSARNPEWLEQNVEAIEARRAAGEMGDEEYEAFQAIVAKAKAGDWESAERESVAFQKAQRPTAEQIEQLPAADSP